jgi:cellulose synthase/poly-beta-1,6-N-acetylglucosamine synthase-like glycosyltransferase
MQIFFWICFSLVIYIYVGYPILLKLLTINKKTIAFKEDHFPTVSILIAAHNEEKYIEDTLLNKLDLNYPKEKFEIIVVSDESEDQTDTIVKRISDQSDINVKLVRQVPRVGKTSGINLIIPEARGEIIVFSDANSIYAKDALTKLVRNFVDSDIGYVTGKMEYVNADGSLVGDGCTSYMKYENWLREQETLVGSIVGVCGGIDAMRKSLYETLQADQLLDFVQPLKVFEKGYRVIYEPEALLREEALENSGQEYAMRVRVTLRALWALHNMRQLLNPAKFGVFSLQLISHKLLRYLAFIPLVICFISNVILLGIGGVYIFFFLTQSIFYFFAWQGKQQKEKKYVPVYYFFPYYFSLLNMACVHATWRYLKGEKHVTWTPRGG